MMFTGHKDRAAAVLAQIRKRSEVHHEHTREVIRQDIPTEIIELIRQIAKRQADVEARVAALETAVAMPTPPPPPPPTVEQLKAMIDEEWTRRVFGEFAFEGETYHADRDSVDNIIGASTMAQEAIGLGVQAGNRYWHYPDPTNPPQGAVEFAWKSKSNGMIPMDAPTVVALGKALFAHKHSHFLAARALKEIDPIPADYTSDTYWP